MDSSQILCLVKKRRSIRQFSDKKIERQQIEVLIEAALWAPSGSNAQAWQFIVVDDGTTLKRLTAFLPGVLEAPPVIICLCIDYERERKLAGKLGVEVLGKMDVSMAAQNIMLGATSMQLGSCAIRGFNDDIISMAIGLPQNVKPELIVTIGYPLWEVKPPKRRTLKEVLHWQKYKSKGGMSNE